MYTYGWFILRFDRKEPNTVKQLSFNKKKDKEKRYLFNQSSQTNLNYYLLEFIFVQFLFLYEITVRF